MKVSLNWLKRYVDIKVPVDELCNRMTMAGFEVEDVEDLSASMENVKVGRIVKLEKHPDADKLQVCQICQAIGENLMEQIQILIFGSFPCAALLFGTESAENGEISEDFPQISQNLAGSVGKNILIPIAPPFYQIKREGKNLPGFFQYFFTRCCHNGDTDFRNPLTDCQISYGYSTH